MVALVTIETVLLVLLAMLTIGLMRSHAEILKWMSSPEQARAKETLPMVPPSRTESSAHDITGTRLDNTPVTLRLARGGRDTLLAFLSSGCTTCARIWNGMQAGVSDDVPASMDVVVVTKDRNYESPSKLARLVPGDAAVVMSSAAWEAYEVPHYPYFIYVDGATGTIGGEGTAEGWGEVVTLLTDFLDDLESSRAPSPGRRVSRVEREDAELAAAGIERGHASLYAPVYEETQLPER